MKISEPNAGLQMVVPDHSGSGLVARRACRKLARVEALVFEGYSLVVGCVNIRVWGKSTSTLPPFPRHPA